MGKAHTKTSTFKCLCTCVCIRVCSCWISTLTLPGLLAVCSLGALYENREQTTNWSYCCQLQLPDSQLPSTSSPKNDWPLVPKAQSSHLARPSQNWNCVQNTKPHIEQKARVFHRVRWNLENGSGSEVYNL